MCLYVVDERPGHLLHGLEDSLHVVELAATRAQRNLRLLTDVIEGVSVPRGELLTEDLPNHGGVELIISGKINLTSTVYPCYNEPRCIGVIFCHIFKHR